MSYLIWSKQTITNFSNSHINSLYNEGYLFTRTGLGDMYQTRSLRIDLSKFELSSENKRILKKTEDVRLKTYNIPYADYTWNIGKMGKDFYTTKFGDGTFSANKIKEVLTTKHNFNLLFVYKIGNWKLEIGNSEVGYCICKETDEILHYSYPFYNLETKTNNLGMGMMLKAINYAKENNKKYVYLGSVKDEAGKYKLQFAGLEWFDGNVWKTSTEELKNILK